MLLMASQRKKRTQYQQGLIHRNYILSCQYPFKHEINPCFPLDIPGSCILCFGAVHNERSRLITIPTLRAARHHMVL